MHIGRIKVLVILSHVMCLHIDKCYLETLLNCQICIEIWDFLERFNCFNPLVYILDYILDCLLCHKQAIDTVDPTLFPLILQESWLVDKRLG